MERCDVLGACSEEPEQLTRPFASDAMRRVHEHVAAWMGEAGLARVSGRFTVDRMVAETAAAYARVAGRGHVAGIENPEVPAPHLRD